MRYLKLFEIVNFEAGAVPVRAANNTLMDVVGVASVRGMASGREFHLKRAFIAEDDPGND